MSGAPRRPPVSDAPSPDEVSPPHSINARRRGRAERAGSKPKLIGETLAEMTPDDGEEER